MPSPKTKAAPPQNHDFRNIICLYHLDAWARPGKGDQASRFPAFPLERVVLSQAFSYQLSAVSFMKYKNWLYYSSKSIVIDPI
jgi:hypothetical protein